MSSNLTASAKLKNNPSESGGLFLFLKQGTHIILEPLPIIFLFFINFLKNKKYNTQALPEYDGTVTNK
ncbi:hypothetical protein BWD09_12350 [Neisseria dentiae]|uniref:Uncharacterized protein n=1 Tax=Neisseria dentiae TaxID=194197 RepID=A0A1X3D1K8_9NEIS|nr:hypothetical protein BWD09_12350 [Neisseria dentiae]